MTAAVQPFAFGAETLRTLDVDGDPWFVAADVAAILGYRMASDATRLLDDDERGTQIVRTPSGDQAMTVVNESGVHALVLRSRRPEAKAFRRWVTGEVLPAIRRTGHYGTAPAPAELSRMDLIHLALAAETERVEAERRAIAAESQVAELAPKAEAADAFLTAEADSLTMVEVAQALRIGRNTLFRRLREMDVIQPGNLPYQRYAHHFDVVLGTYVDRNGVTHPTHTTRVRPSGVDFIRRKLGIEVAA